MSVIVFWLFAFVVFMLLIHTKLPGKLVGRAALAPLRIAWRLTLGRRGK